MITPEENERLDKRNAAIHEAGHLTVALAEGLPNASSWLVRTGSTSEYENTWVGQTRAARDSISPAMAMAGTVAECLDRKPDIDVTGILKRIKNGTVMPSETDLKHAPIAKRPKAIETALAKLREHKSFFDGAVSELIESEAVPNGRARAMFRDLQRRPKAKQARAKQGTRSKKRG